MLPIQASVLRDLYPAYPQATSLIAAHVFCHSGLLQVFPMYTGFMLWCRCFNCSLCLEATPPLLPPGWETPTQLSRWNSVIASSKNSFMATSSLFRPTDPCAVFYQGFYELQLIIYPYIYSQPVRLDEGINSSQHEFRTYYGTDISYFLNSFPQP